MKKILMMVLMAGIALSTNAQWNNWHTTQAISGGVGILGSIIASSERKKAMEIFEREKAQYQPTFEKVYNEAKSLESEEKWADALDKYEEAAKLNCDYGYTDQKSVTLKINSLYEKAGRTEEGPSVLNNKTTILPDYTRYRFTAQNPISKGKKDNTQTQGQRQTAPAQCRERDSGSCSDQDSMAIPEVALRPSIPCPAHHSRGI